MKATNPLNLLDLPLPLAAGEKKAFGRLLGAAQTLTLLATATQAKGPVLVVCPDNLSANQWLAELQCLSQGMKNPPELLLFPDWETLPYDHFSPYQDLISARLIVLHRLPRLHRGIVLVPINTLLHRLAPTDYVAKHTLCFQKGETLVPETFSQHLIELGYHQVSQVMEHGEYTLRGSIIDLFPMGSDTPLRIDLFDNEIETIRTFDPETQRTLTKQTELLILPAKEFPIDDDAIKLFRQQWRKHFLGNPLQCPLYENMSQGIVSAGIDYYLPLFFKETAGLLDYLPASALIMRHKTVPSLADTFWETIKKRYEQYGGDLTRPLLPPHTLFFETNDLFASMKAFPLIEFSEHVSKTYSLACEIPSDLRANNKAKQPFQKLMDHLEQNSHRVVFCAESAGRKEMLLKLLSAQGIKPKSFDHWQQFYAADDRFGMIIGVLEQGVVLSDLQIEIITENQLFGQYVIQKRHRRVKGFQTDHLIKDLVELQLGAPVVHEQHGVGRYIGLENLTVNETNAEYVTLEYADGDRIYVPVTALHLISRYSGSDPEHAPLNKLGTDHFSKAKQKAQAKIREVAAELLDLYAKRAARKGFAFNSPNEDYERFTADFPFEETPDQAKVIEDVIQDMTQAKPMDRLVCGDVGFGKTEVAIRAAFLAVQSNKQVALLVPTTLLADQHFQTFQDRFANWPIRIDCLSRFRTAKEQTLILDRLQKGSVDLVIGTHKLLQKTTKFHDLGLLIIDEEHRFGVRQKDFLKNLRAEVDILNLTATPIPRTLNMTMVNLRDISIIATPPAKRLAIKTFVYERNEAIIREAIEREISRGGQVFFLHNRVETIQRVEQEIAKWVPKARCRIAHGQMPEKQLENIMIDFYHQRFNILLCTTIIENGIDIPTANTMIIDRADRFGLAQLHQLRGRVGRSHHQAYTYLMTPHKKVMTTDAIKRLDAISALEELGSGFILATQDLEIRGAGELLGEEQSGHIDSIGFSLYMDLLDRTIKAFQSGEMKETNIQQIFSDINLQISAFIPENYIRDIHVRLTLYKRIAHAKSQKNLEDLQVEMIDRFGLLPQPLQNLFVLTEIKLNAEKIRIEKIHLNKSGGTLTFTKDPAIDLSALIQLIQQQPDTYQLQGSDKLKINRATETETQRLDLVIDLLKTISPDHGKMPT